MMTDPFGWRGYGASLGAAVVLWSGVVPMMVRAEPVGDDLGWVTALEVAVEIEDFMERHPIEWDWLRQDCGLEQAREILTGERRVIGSALLKKVLEGIPGDRERLGQSFEQLLQAGVEDGDVAWLRLYAEAAEVRRAGRLASLVESAPRVVLVRRRTIRPSFFAYTEGQSDAQAERHFLPDSALCLLTLDGTRGTVDELLADSGGVIRDPAVSWDGRRVAFAWKKSLDDDDYGIHELDMETREIRRITGGKGVADYEPAYLPDGGFVFSSSRCVQTVDCWWTEVSNLYTCGPDGQHLRRLGFDQVHTVYPQVLDDGRVIYTRWDYNDRGQVFPQPLFQMNADGTGQTEFYGNNSWFPTTIAHARGIPGTSKVLAILCGHHSSQAGKLAVIDPAVGRQENLGVTLVSPQRETPAERIDSYGQQGELFAYPYPLGETEWLVSYAPDGWEKKNKRRDDAAFGIYWMDVDGRRELLVPHAGMPVVQPVPLAARKAPAARSSTVDYRRDSGSYYVHDIYQGPGLEGVERGTIRKLRVVALDFRPAGIRSNESRGPGGGALVSTPIAIGNGSWDVKKVLGETPVHEDGSASFVVPARTPVYFQMLDERGRAVQTMRSWSTVQPGENASCVGCHESKNSSPPAQGYGATLAMAKPLLELEPFHGPARGFSFAEEIQPILNRHCVTCHHHREPVLAMARGERAAVLEQSPESRSPEERRAFSLTGDTIADDKAGRAWSDAYLVLTQARRDGGDRSAFRGHAEGTMVRWISSQSVPTPLEPGFAGSTRSGLLELLEGGHFGVELTTGEYEKIACWIDLLVPFCGDYTEGNLWTDKEMRKFRHFEAKRKGFEMLEQEAIREYIRSTGDARGGKEIGD